MVPMLYDTEASVRAMDDDDAGASELDSGRSRRVRQDLARGNENGRSFLGERTKSMTERS